MFDGDWHLALASYNGGPGPRAARREALRASTTSGRSAPRRGHLPRETREYVPMILAADDHRPQSRRSTASTCRRRSPLATDVVTRDRPGRPAPRRRVGRRPGRRHPRAQPRTAPLDDAGARSATTSCGADRHGRRRCSRPTPRPPRTRPRRCSDYTVRKGESLPTIARKLRVSRTDLAEANYLRTNARVRPGQKLVVPRAPSPALLARRGDTAPAADAPRRRRGAVEAVADATPTTVIYRVRKGDTLFSIARRHGVTIENLRAWNSLRGSALSIGDRLSIQHDPRCQRRSSARGFCVVSARRRAPHLSAHSARAAGVTSRLIRARSPRWHPRLEQTGGMLAQVQSAALRRHRRAAGVGRGRRRRSACRCSRWSACPTPACARAATACGRRSATPASTSRRTASPSTSRRPTCARPAPPSTCRLRVGDSRRRRRRAAPRRARASRSSASCRSTARCCPPAACCRSPSGCARHGVAALLLPAANARRGRGGATALRVVPVRDARRGGRVLRGDPRGVAGAPPRPRRSRRRRAAVADLADVRGQAAARRALEIAAAGGHHLLLVGPPGAGKTMLARRLPGILPPLGFDEALDVTAVHSVAGLLAAGAGLLGAAAVPRAAPHQLRRRAGRRRQRAAARARSRSRTTACCSSTSCPSFRRRALEALRQPLEEGRMRIARAAGTRDVPGRVHARRGDEPVPVRLRTAIRARPCRCTPTQVQQYHGPAVGAAARSPRPHRRGGAGSARHAERTAPGESSATVRRPGRGGARPVSATRSGRR